MTPAAWAPTAALAVASGLIALAFERSAPHVSTSGVTFLACAPPVLLAPLFWPRASRPGGDILRALLGPVVAAIGAGLVLWAIGGVAPSSAHLLPTALVAVAVLALVRQAVVLAGHVLELAGVASGTAAEWARWTVTAIFWLAAAFPLWLGPVADLAARGSPGVPSVILGSSPLVHLASAAGYDLLRSPWFYGHSSLGALQVDYPGTGVIVFASVAAALLLTLAAVPFERRSHDTGAASP